MIIVVIVWLLIATALGSFIYSLVEEKFDIVLSNLEADDFGNAITAYWIGSFSLSFLGLVQSLMNGPHPTQGPKEA